MTAAGPAASFTLRAHRSPARVSLGIVMSRAWSANYLWSGNFSASKSLGRFASFDRAAQKVKSASASSNSTMDFSDECRLILMSSLLPATQDVETLIATGSILGEQVAAHPVKSTSLDISSGRSVESDAIDRIVADSVVVLSRRLKRHIGAGRRRMPRHDPSRIPANRQRHMQSNVWIWVLAIVSVL